MAGHPLNSARGLRAFNRLDLGTSQITFDADSINFEDGIQVSGISTALLTANSTGQFILPAGAKVSNAAGGVVTANSTTLIAAKGVKVSNAAGGALTANSTGINLPGNVRVGGISTAIITGNSTGRIVLTNGVRISNAAGGDITADSTGAIMPGDVRVSGISTAAISADSTGRVVLPAGLKLSNAMVLSADSTAINAPNNSALPGNWSTGIISIASNSTGAWIGLRTTGTTWKYVNVTTALPT